MLYVFKLYSPTCPACAATEHLYRMMQREFGSHAFFNAISIAEPEKILAQYDSKEDFYADMIKEKFFLPIDLDPNISKEEKEEYKARGETKSYGLPCFVFVDTDRLPEFELMIGGIGDGYTWKDELEFIRDFRKIMMKMLRRKDGICAEEWLWKRQYQNPYAQQS